ncbi:MAG TPA: hypothetical protein VGB18_03240 [Candidatus Thermoplasmatota archaeon]
MAHAKHRTAQDDEFTRIEAKADRRDRRQADADEKAAHPPKSRGLRSQGDVSILEADRPRVDNPRGRRAKPTRFDAMPIAGHERLRGYDTPITTRDESMHYPGPLEDPRAQMPRKPPAGPDAMRIRPEEAHDLQQASEDSVTDAIEDASEKAFDDASFDEHVGSTDLSRRSRSADQDEQDKVF